MLIYTISLADILPHYAIDCIDIDTRVFAIRCFESAMSHFAATPPCRLFSDVFDAAFTAITPPAERLPSSSPPLPYYS
jgi:hypothetical protein